VDEREPQQIVERYLAEVLNGGDPGAATALIADDAFWTGVHRFRAAFPDLRVTAGPIVAQGELVAVHLTGHGTHRGVFQGCPPTGREWTATCTSIYRVEAGQITRAWVNWDLLTVMEQLGAVERAATVSA
jgi:predicted ester cyclase